MEKLFSLTFYTQPNGIHMDCTNDDVAETGLAVASGKMDYDSLLQWVKDHRA